MASSFDSVMGMFQRTPSLSTALKNNDISAPVQEHLARVFATLAFGVVVVAMGAWAHMATHLGGIMSAIGSIACMFWLASEHANPASPLEKRLGIYTGFSFLQGLSIGGLVEIFFIIGRTDLLLTALVGTSLAFACFALSAMLAKRRSYLYLGGLIGTGMSMLMLLSFISIFVASPWAYAAHLYLGLFVFCGYVIFDTQMVIEKASVGERDYVWHAVELLVDFVAIFVRIAIILLRNAEKKDSRRNRR